MILPVILLLIMYPTLRYIYYKPEEIRPCSGVCNLTDADIASAPEGCKPSNPDRLFFIQIPRTASKSMHKAMLARRLDKGWTTVSVKDWRDASMWLPVFANKMHVGLPPSHNEQLYLPGLQLRQQAVPQHQHFFHAYSHRAAHAVDAAAAATVPSPNGKGKHRNHSLTRHPRPPPPTFPALPEIFAGRLL
jgi:hypothetical protein